LYLTLVKSQLNNSSQVWFPESALWMKRIGVQKRATLWILKLKCGDLSYVERLTQLYLLPLAYDREIKDLTFYYKCRYDLIDLDTFAPVVCSLTRQGSSSYLQTPFCKTSTFKSSYFNRIVNLWNFILRIAPSSTFLTLNSFKTFLYNTYVNSLSLIAPSCALELGTG
jgi:hypothetical protein